MNEKEYEEFYSGDTLAEFESKILELKTALMNSVKLEYEERLNSLAEENKKLRAVEQEYREEKQRCAEMSKAVEKAAKEAEKMRLFDLLRPFTTPMYVVKEEWRYIKPKCDKCDDNRMIHFKSPRGADYTEDCECKKYGYIYTPVPVSCYKIEQECNFEPKYFLQFHKTELYFTTISFSRINTTDDNCDFAELDWRNVIFKSKEKCQEYCDWLNAEQGNED